MGGSSSKKKREEQERRQLEREQQRKQHEEEARQKKQREAKEKQLKKHVDETIEKSSCKNKHVSMTVLGHSGSGKTSLIRRLHGEQFIPAHKHTETVDIHTSTINKEETQWKKLKQLGFIDFFKQKLYKFFSSKEKNSKATETVSCPEEDLPTFIRIWDFAGDLEFYALQQLFLTRNTVYVVVIDLSLKLNEVADMRNSWTSQEFVDYWFNCIYSASRKANTDPRVMIVGTHKDKVGEDRKAIESIFHKMKEMIKLQPYRHMLVEECFSIANNSENDLDAIAIKEKFLEISKSILKEEDKIPMKYLALKDKIEEMSGNGEHALSKSEFSNACNDLKLLAPGEEGNCDMTLHQFHDSGDLIYFDNLSMEKNIFLKPQWFADRCNDIMGFNAGSGKLQGELFNFRNTGFISEATLKSVWRNDKDLLTELLKQFGLFVRYDKSLEITNRASEAGEGYVCPVFLPVIELEYTSFHYPPLVIQPISRFIPIGVTSHIISEFILKHGWKVSSLSLHRGVLKPPACKSLELLFEEVQQRKGQCFRISYKVSDGEDIKYLVDIRKQMVQRIKDILEEEVNSGTICSRKTCEDFISLSVETSPNFTSITCMSCQLENKIGMLREWFLTDSEGGRPVIKLMEDSDSVLELIDQKTPDLMGGLEFSTRFIAKLMAAHVIDKRISDLLKNEPDGDKQVDILMGFIRMDPVVRFKNFARVLKDPKLGQLHVLDLLFS